MPKLERKSKTLSIGEILEWNEGKKLNLNPSYQRKSAWSKEQKSFLIDSILRNYPIPPIFLRTNLDSTTGKATYDVIDGKQRLTSIFEFINGDIPSSSNDELQDEISGILFDDLQKDASTDLRTHFWSYEIPVEYVTTDNDKLIDHVFDRLNRNGERLTGQELRNSQYYDSKLLNFIKQQAASEEWQASLDNLKTNRLEDHELLSELLFLVIEQKVLDSSDKGKLDELYLKHKSPDDEVLARFELVKKAFFSFDISDLLNSLGVSHIYGLWSLAEYCIRKGIDYSAFKTPLVGLYKSIAIRGPKTGEIGMYKLSMISNTKSASQRQKRLDALKAIVGITE